MKIILAAVNAKYIHTALGVRALKAYVNTPEVNYTEFTINEQPQSILRRLYLENADTIMFSCYIWNIEFILKIAESLKKISPTTLIVLGGPEVTYDSVEYVEKYSFIDGIIRGEGEEILKDFLEVGLKAKGIVYRDNDGIHKDAPLRSVCDINSLPFPYSDEEIKRDKNKLIYYESSRGCPFRCSYCFSSTENNVRFRNIEKVKRELMRFVKGGVRIVKFIDRTFNADKKRAAELVRFLNENGGTTQFHFEIAADLLNEELIELFQKSPKGMYLLEIGVQSTNDNTIHAIDRKTDFAIIANAVRKLKGHVHMHLDLIAGLPYEGYESFVKSFNDVMELNPDVLQLGFLKLLRGTKIRSEYKKYGYEFNSFAPYEILHNNYISYDEILQLKKVEYVLEKYHNSETFINSMGCLVKKFRSSYEMFNELAGYFEMNGYFDIGHSQSDLYKILHEFCDDEQLCDYIKLDYFMNTHNPSTPSWSNMPFDKTLLKARFEILNNDFVRKHFPEYVGMSVKELIKWIQPERFMYDVLGDGERCDNIILFDKKYKRVVRVD